MDGSAKTHTLPLNINLNLNISIDSDGNRYVSYHLVGPFGGSSSQVSNLNRNYEPMALESLRETLALRLDEFIEDQIQAYTRREIETNAAVAARASGITGYGRAQ